jgi:hypothetical protein
VILLEMSSEGSMSYPESKVRPSRLPNATELSHIVVTDQRTDHRCAASVQRGVEMLKAQGRHAVASELKKENVPEHVILRVVSGAAFRRKTINSAPPIIVVGELDLA